MNDNQLLNNYIDAFKQLSIMGKRQEIIDNLKEFIAMIDILAQKENIEIQYLKSSEINDIKKELVSEDDYLEAILVYFEVAKSVLGQYLIKHDNIIE